MTKQHFIALADMIKTSPNVYTDEQLQDLANFCQAQNPRFNRSRWLGYIAGVNGKNGGKK